MPGMPVDRREMIQACARKPKPYAEPSVFAECLAKRFTERFQARLA